MSETSYQSYSPGKPGPEAPWRPSDAIERAEERAVRPSYSRKPRCVGAPDGLVVASAICVLIWATSGFGYFWPIWVLLPTFLPVLLRALRARG